MVRGVNKVILVGNLGDEPTFRKTNNGFSVTNFSMVTNDSRRNPETNEFVEVAEWHRIVLYGRTAEVANQYLHKGSQVYIEGKIRTRSYVDKNNIKRYSTEIVADDMHMLGSRPAAYQGGAQGSEMGGYGSAMPRNNADSYQGYGSDYGRDNHESYQSNNNAGFNQNTNAWQQNNNMAPARNNSMGSNMGMGNNMSNSMGGGSLYNQEPQAYQNNRTPQNVYGQYDNPASGDNSYTQQLTGSSAMQQQGVYGNGGREIPAQSNSYASPASSPNRAASETRSNEQQEKAAMKEPELNDEIPF